jgi:hypothetical protein
MLFPRLASLALILTSCLLTQVANQLLAPEDGLGALALVFILTYVACGVGIIFGSFGFLASFSLSRLPDGSYSMNDDGFNRFLLRFKFLKFEKKASFCAYSLEYGISLFVSISGIAIITTAIAGGIYLAYTDWVLFVSMVLYTGMALGVLVGFFVALLAVMLATTHANFRSPIARNAVALGGIGALVCGGFYFAPQSTGNITTFGFALLAVLIVGTLGGLAYYLKTVLARTTWYSNICPTVVPKQSDAS